MFCAMSNTDIQDDIDIMWWRAVIIVNSLYAFTAVRLEKAV